MRADPSGGDAYDDEVTARYLVHRHAGASPNVVMEEPAVLAHIGALAGRRVVDLGCGDGRFADTVLGGGARTYLGVDASAAMIEVARSGGRDPRARFEVGRIEDLDLPSGGTDLVVARMAFHHLPDLRPTLRRVHRGLAPGGGLVFTVVHPVITSFDDGTVGPRASWTVDRYFDEGERKRAWFGAEVTWFHRTVEHHVAAVLESGFTIEGLSECAPDAGLLADDPEELARRRRVPLILLIAARRT